MEEKIAVHCKSKKEWHDVEEESFRRGISWTLGPEHKIWWSLDKCLIVSGRCLSHADIRFCKSEGCTIISAQEYLQEGEIEEFKVGDKVEFIKGDMCGNEAKEWWRSEDLKLGNIYTISRVSDKGNFKVKSGGLWHNKGHFKIANSATKPKLSDADYLEENHDAVCVICRSYYEEMPSHCEGARCAEAGELYLEENPNIKTSKENNMKENNINKNVAAVFSNKSGEELLLVDKHYSQDMMDRILMETHKVAILKACKSAEAELLEESKK